MGNKQRAITIDWKEIQNQIEAIRINLEQGMVRTPEAKKNILKTRAKALAQEAALTETSQESIEVIEFLLAYERYGLESRYVREIYPLKEITPLPGTPSFVLGLVSVRGQILSVIDIKKFFDLPEKGLTDLNKIIILESEHQAMGDAGEMVFGILADSVQSVRRVFLNEMQPSLPTLSGIREEFLKGITLDHTVILDAGKLLSSKDIVVRQEIDV